MFRNCVESVLAWLNLPYNYASPSCAAVIFGWNYLPDASILQSVNSELSLSECDSMIFQRNTANAS